MIQSFATFSIERPDSRQLLEQLYQERTLQPFRSGQTIPMRPDEIWVACRGIVVINTLHPTGDEALLSVVTPSMPFGLPLTWITPYQAIALTHVDLLALTITEVERSPALCQGLFRHLSRRLQQSEAFLALSGCRRVEERLKQLLILLQHEVGQPMPSGTRLNVRLTHQQLANAIGTTRVTVTRLLGQLKQEGWLSIDTKRHIILP
ncbi:MAG: Crp/Fnr family transcriptional regulator [Leptolyngbya sp. Prado105]|nr:Crp/Fnr family transcriptional regulator [Leptolyngbya sp. Prado105]